MVIVVFYSTANLRLGLGLGYVRLRAVLRVGLLMRLSYGELFEILKITRLVGRL